MKKIYLYCKNEINNPPLEVEVADNFLSRFMGLMGRKKLPENTGLLISPCNSVHMCFMRFPIDVVYVDEGYKVLKVVENLSVWSGLSVCWQAWGVIELPVGTIKKYDLRKNHTFFVSSA